MNLIGFLLGITFSSIIIYLLSKKREYLYYTKKGKLYIGFLGVAVITIMDELTSIFYAPGEAYNFIGYKAFFYLFLTSLLIFMYSLTMTEIAEILEANKVKGGGVYSFSYLVFGTTASFVAAASIVVDYVNTAAMSSISAIENLNFFFHMPTITKIILELLIIWFIAIINLLGARENAKTTYILFVAVVYIFLITFFIGALHLSYDHVEKGVNIVKRTVKEDFLNKDLLKSLELISVGLGSTILAYSGIESVLQTHKLAENWRTIYKAYITLGLTVGIFTPLIGGMALLYVSHNELINHKDDLITFYANLIGGHALSISIVILASLTLAFAVNTAMVGSVELLSSMADNYKAYWISKTNRFSAHYRIILFMSAFFSFIVIITQGNQDIVADMYAIGLIATFVMNLGGVIIYKYVRGSAQLKEYRTSIIKNSLLFVLFGSTFIYIILHKPYGAFMWISTVIFFIIFGFVITRIKSPEEDVLAKADTYESLIEYIKKIPSDTKIDIYFRRPSESVATIKESSIYITLFLARQRRAPKKLFPQHFILPVNTFWGIGSSIENLLEEILNETNRKNIRVHFGWPLSSWIERMSTGVMVYKILKLPKKIPYWEFVIEYFPRKEK